MANPRTPSPIYQLFLAFFILTTLMQTKVFSYQHKVGDLDAWGVPTSANPQVYAKWSKSHTFKIGDSLCKSSFHFNHIKKKKNPYFSPLGLFITIVTHIIVYFILFYFYK